MSPVPIGLYALAGFCTGTGMRMLDALLPLLAGDLGITVAAATGVVAAFVLPYGVVQLVAGPLGDRFGKPRVATVALCGYGLAMLASAAAPDLPALIAFRAASGACGGAVIPLLMAHLGDSIAYEERQAAIGRFSTGMVMAMLLGGPAAGVLGDAAGWRAPFLLLGLVALGVCGAMALRLGLAALLRPPARGASGSPATGRCWRAGPGGGWCWWPSATGPASSAAPSPSSARSSSRNSVARPPRPG